MSRLVGAKPVIEIDKEPSELRRSASPPAALRCPRELSTRLISPARSVGQATCRATAQGASKDPAVCQV